jgi:hypothetical protein
MMCLWTYQHLFVFYFVSIGFCVYLQIQTFSTMCLKRDYILRIDLLPFFYCNILIMALCNILIFSLSIVLVLLLKVITRIVLTVSKEYHLKFSLFWNESSFRKWQHQRWNVVVFFFSNRKKLVTIMAMSLLTK